MRIVRRRRHVYAGTPPGRRRSLRSRVGGRWDPRETAASARFAEWSRITEDETNQFKIQWSESTSDDRIGRSSLKWLW